MTTMWITIIVYIAVLIAIAVITGKHSKSITDLTIGGRNTGAWLSALSYGTAYFSAVMFVGYAGTTGLEFGLWGVLAGIGNGILGTWLAWKVLARRTRNVTQRLKLQTMPQIFEFRFKSRAMKTFSCIIIFIFLIPYSASVYKGLGSISEILLGIDETVFMIIIAALSALLLVFGGYLVQARADFIQGIIMMFGIVLLIVYMVRCDRVGGLSGLVEYAKSEVGLPKLSSGKWVSLWATVLMTSFGTWGLPQMIQKYFGIRDDAQAKKGIKISTFFSLLVAGGGYFIGSLCHKYFTVGKDMPAKDYIVPNMLKVANFPQVLLGVVIVLLLAASISTLCSITLTASSTFSLDFIKGTVKKNMTDNSSKILTKFLCVLFAIASFVVAKSNTPILDMMSYSWGIISGSFLAPYVISLFWKGLNKIGAWVGILGGFCIAVVPALCKLLPLFGYNNETISALAGKGPLFACIAMISSILLCFVFSAAANGFKTKNDNDFFYNGVIEQK
ncbi:MAG: sodium:solute symporter family protein [Clostridiales bacterium]|nr:sodium:solute symporter family protein [Clostridiales bacterium]